MHACAHVLTGPVCFEIISHIHHNNIEIFCTNCRQNYAQYTVAHTQGNVFYKTPLGTSLGTADPSFTAVTKNNSPNTTVQRAGIGQYCA